MKINLIGKSFDINSGQGIYRYSGEILKELKKTNNKVFINKKGNINHVQQPELIWNALFKKNVITTIHDIMPLFILERKKIFNIFFKISVLIAIWKSKKIIAVSENTKKDILKYFKVNPKNIIVINEGVSENFYPIKKIKKIKIGYVGGLGKRKNIEFIIKLAKIMPEINFKIGGKGPNKERLEKISKDMNLKNVEFLGFISNKELNNFYNSLDLFIFPSFYEGFGLPVVEAMACGIPCVVSDKGSLPEVAGEAGTITDINNLNKSKNIIKGLLKNKKRLLALSSMSIKRAKDFNWKDCSKKTLEIYRNIK